MPVSFRTFMSGLIDYAGLFPPARLPLDDAIRAYAAYRRIPDAWMLSRFICPSTRLEELGAYDDLFAAGEPFRFSVLGRGGSSRGEFLEGLAADLAAIAAFERRHAGRVVADVFEVRLPADVVASGCEDTAAGLVAAALDAIDPASSGRITPWFEGGFPDGWEHALPSVWAGMRHANTARQGDAARRPGGVSLAGYKLRCGGVEASAFPPVRAVASVIAGCRDAGLGLKFTAGLHHPVRRFAESVDTKMHGFLNVFGAAILAHADGLDVPALMEILADEDPVSFAFDDAGLSWRAHRVSTEFIADARRRWATSYGSCSFDEPREDLAALGLL